MDIIRLETPADTEKYTAPRTDDESPFFIPEYGRTYSGTPCYQLRLESPVACIQYVLSGSGIVMCDDTLYAVRKGDTFLLPEGSSQIYYSHADNQFERIWVNFRGELARALFKIYDLKDIVVYKGTDTSHLLLEIQEVCSRAENPQEYKNRSALLFLELVQFLAAHREQKPESIPALEQLRLYINRHITRKLSLSDLAEQFSFSEEHIIRIFRKAYGITPHQYIIQSRIRLAMIMLKNTDDSVEEISEKLCFCDPHHFSAQFLKHVGYRPSRFRKLFQDPGSAPAPDKKHPLKADIKC